MIQAFHHESYIRMCELRPRLMMFDAWKPTLAIMVRSFRVTHSLSSAACPPGQVSQSTSCPFPQLERDWWRPILPFARFPQCVHPRPFSLNASNGVQLETLNLAWGNIELISYSIYSMSAMFLDIPQTLLEV